MESDRLLLALLLTTLVLFGGACASSAFDPVELYPEDMCSRCKMAISDKRFAGEILSGDGSVRKFDDLGCMFGVLREGSDASLTGFVMDFEDRGWVNMKEAYYIDSDHLKTPMGSGLIAVRDQRAAELAESKYAGRMTSYLELRGKGE